MARGLRRSLRFVLVVGLAAAPLRAAADADPLLVTLNEVKARYRNREYGEAQAALKRLSELAAAPQFEAVRDRIVPAILFYDAAVRFELRDEARARDAVEAYLKYVPNASLDPGLYPKKFVAFFEKVQREMSDAAEALAPGEANSGSIGGGVLPSYASFALDESAAQSMERDPAWGEGAARFLFVGDEARRWKRLADEDARRQFQSEFWLRRDPTPATPENEARTEFTRRVQFADANFSTESMKGSVTDRGMVFVVMGAPTYVGRSDIDPKEDSVGYLRSTEEKIVGSTTFRTAVRVDSETPRVGAGEKMGRREIWYYKRDRLPADLPWKELRLEFQTKEGYGNAVLQKDAIVMTAIRKAAELASRPTR